ncbi:hypothetical protein [Polymorphobacter fuscus]|uniref:DUF1269 domain-containing protein n=1 Tax=Sandarakinorhabdus fusca TaxID=1439888 RepID=A0A7C9GS88_9SPHN|nr:hypothetical protein [Polymorphobacter fuscus]KAB7646468.1 hypothetical protein F9290_10605 [Polymorphobacter fuscus]MQT17711.1 hypothetical protein [Polymorphobacter fuscus]NJC09741.1 hypothetical protein [Polymorphobacter fuscus]
MSQFVASAVFDNESEADLAVRDLRNAGVPDSALSIIAQHEGKTTTTDGTGEVEGDGSVIRGLLGGGALGAGLAVAALAIPGVGPLAAAGAIAAYATPGAMAAGAALGAVAGGLNEGLQKHGVSSDDATYYDERIGGGGTLVAVDETATGVSADQVREILYRNGGHSSAQSRMAPAY